jgi:hypothetical protein
LVEEILSRLRAGNDEEGGWNAPGLWSYFQRCRRTLKGGFKTSPELEGASQDSSENRRLKITDPNGRMKSITYATFRSYVAEAKRTASAIG